MIVIANDITTSIGSFGTKEDQLFLRASQLARRLKCPRVYLAANSGARLGIAREVLSLFRVAWEDPNVNPEKGFKYIYLTPEDYSALSARPGKERVVDAELVQDGGESRYKINAIVGSADDDDIGVENLSAAGQITRAIRIRQYRVGPG